MHVFRRASGREAAAAWPWSSTCGGEFDGSCVADATAERADRWAGSQAHDPLYNPAAEGDCEDEEDALLLAKQGARPRQVATSQVGSERPDLQLLSQIHLLSQLGLLSRLPVFASNPTLMPQDQYDGPSQRGQ